MIEKHFFLLKNNLLKINIFTQKLSFLVKYGNFDIEISSKKYFFWKKRNFGKYRKCIFGNIGSFGKKLTILGKNRQFLEKIDNFWKKSTIFEKNRQFLKKNDNFWKKSTIFENIRQIC